MKKVLILISCFLVSCSKTDISHVDNSHTPLEAIEHGAPSIERDWVSSEFGQYLEYMKSLPDSVSYPMYHSSTSGPLFQKLISSLDQRPSNVEVEADEMKLQLIGSKITYMTEIGQLYTNRFTEKKGDYILEMTYYMMGALQLMHDAVVMMEEIYDRPISTGNTGIISQDRIDNIKVGCLTALNGYLTFIGDEENLDEDEFLLIANNFTRYFPYMMSMYDGGARRELEIKIKKYTKSHSNELIRKGDLEVLGINKSVD